MSARLAARPASLASLSLLAGALYERPSIGKVVVIVGAARSTVQKKREGALGGFDPTCASTWNT